MVPGQRYVALRKESVDRNAEDWLNAGCLPRVALRKESVDRNTNYSPVSLFDLPSLSARRAWIEIPHAAYAGSTLLVALRKESVDRNFRYAGRHLQVIESLSARRAWIEMFLMRLNPTIMSRSPQGERG